MKYIYAWPVGNAQGTGWVYSLLSKQEFYIYMYYGLGCNIYI
jgi:hypothetical protein